MKEITPISSLAEFKQAFDNGGRFYNVFTKADDNILAASELAKAAGTYGADSTAILHFEFLRLLLPVNDRATVLEILDDRARSRREEHQPIACSPAKLHQTAKPGETAIIAGYAKPRTSRSESARHVLVKVKKGEVVQLKKMLVSDQFDLYELFETPDRKKMPAHVVASREVTLPHWSKIVLGGVVREFAAEEGADLPGTYLEAQMFARILE
ncbi:hypothetical protein ACFL59_10540 [Planctomycetota bacterium]